MNKLLKLTAVVLLGLLTTTVAYGAMGSYWKTISDLIPRTDMAVDIGDATHYVGNLYVSTSTMNSLTVNDFFTLGGTVGVGGIDMANYLITNIGNASTDFTSGGGLNLAGALSVTGTSTLGITTITNLTLGSVSNTEFGYLDGITSAIQTQLGLKAPLASPTFTGNVTMPGTGIWNSSGNVGIGTTSPGYKLDVQGTGGFTGTVVVGTPVPIPTYPVAVSTYKAGVEEVPTFRLPQTSNFAEGLVVPMPTLPVPSIVITLVNEPLVPLPKVQSKSVL